MPNLTLAGMRARIQVLVPDAGVANADINSVIQTAHDVFPMEFFVDHTDESITLASQGWAYALPETSGVSTFVFIRDIYVESETLGFFEEILPHDLWRVNYDGTGVWTLQIDRRWIPVSGRKLRIVGQKRYSMPAADLDIVTLHNGWVIQYAAGLIHAAQGGSESAMAVWHQRMAAFHFTAAQDLADNINNRAYPSSYRVPGVI